jgi:hypothetical protein
MWLKTFGIVIAGLCAKLKWSDQTCARIGPVQVIRSRARDPLGAAAGRSYSARNEVVHMKKSAIKVGNEWQACEVAVPPVLKIAVANSGTDWVNPPSQGSIELIVAQALEIPSGDYLLRLNGREMLFRVTRQKLHRVWGDAISASSQYDA